MLRIFSALFKRRLTQPVRIMNHAASEPKADQPEHINISDPTDEPSAKRIKEDDASTGPTADQSPAAAAAAATATTGDFLRETDVGITEFITPGWAGFDGIIKHRFSDFFVNEIDPQGKVIHLTSYTDANDPTPEPTTEEKAIEAMQVPEDAQEAFDQAFPRLAEIIGETDAQAIRAHLEVNPEGRTLEERTLKLDRDLEKAQRAGVYLVTKNFLATQLTVETVDGRLLFIQRVSGPEGGRKEWKKAQRAQRPRGWGAQWKHVGDHCYFVLQKENADTMDVLSQIARQLHVSPRSFGMAGTKDKRGITVQRCSAFKVEHTRLIWASKKLRGARLGNFSYAQAELKLGDLKGNRFCIVLRHVRGADEQSLAPVLEGIRQTGFVNYYGMQRFGTQSVASHTVGLAMLKSQWKQAVELVLCPRAGDAKDMAGARTLWADGQISEALAALPNRGALAERSILQDLVQQQQKAGVSNWAAGFACIPRNLRLMYVHAYQSYVWNTAASRRLQLYGVAGAVPGDLVVEAGDLAPDAGRVQPVVVTAETAHQYSIYDVVLPLPGWDVRYPENQVAAVYNDIMGKDEMSPERMAEHPMKEYRLAGAYRHVVIRPRDFSHQWMRYRDDKLPLARSDSDRIEGKHEPESIEFGELVALKLEFDLPSSAYATMLLRELMRQETAAGHQTTLSNGTNENE